MKPIAEGVGEFEESEVVNLLDFESGGEKRGGFKQCGHGRSPQLEVMFLLYKADGQRPTGGHRTVVIWGDRSHLRRLRSSPIDVRSSGYGRRSSHDGEDFGECEGFIKHFVFNRTCFLASIRNLK